MINQFNKSKVARDNKCQEKDKVIVSYLDKLCINKPKDYKAILMPCLYGPEAYILRNKKVPANNIFACEQDKEVHKEIQLCKRKDRQELKGLVTTFKPQVASKALDSAYLLGFDKVNLIYFDYFGKCDYKEHYKNTFLKIFSVNMIADKGIFITTFGLNRCTKEVSELNNKVLDLINKGGYNVKSNEPSVVYALAAIKEADHRLPKKVSQVVYESEGGNNKFIKYVTTIMEW